MIRSDDPIRWFDPDFVDTDFSLVVTWKTNQCELRDEKKTD